MRKSRKNTVIPNDGDPWSPVDVDAIARKPVTPPEPLEIKGGDVTAHLNLGAEPTEEEKAEADQQVANDSGAEEEQGTTEGDETAAEVEEAEQSLTETLAEKLAALDAAKAGRPKKSAKK